MTISIIGSGNIAHYFANCFLKSGFEIRDVWSRDEGKGKIFAESFQASFKPKIQDFSADADIIILAVKDDAIKDVSKMLPRTNALIVHTAGSVSLDVISPEIKYKAVIWPVYSINKNHLPDNIAIPLVIEIENEAYINKIEELAKSISPLYWFTNYEQRKRLHLAAVMSHNFMNHLLALAEMNCKEQQLPFDILKPIIQQTFENAMTFSALESQTGPAIRNDVQTMERHLELLKNSEEQAKIYLAISDSIQKIYNHHE